MTDGDYAVIIGVHDYAHLRRLDGPLNDAYAVRDWLVSAAEVPEENCRLVIAEDQPGEPVTKALHDAFNEIWLSAIESGARRLYVYFAGHGLSRGLRRLMLLAADMRPTEHLAGLAVDTDRYHEVLADAPLFPEQVFWYDCCRDYDGRVKGEGPQFGWPSPEPPPNLRQLVLYAAAFDDRANERLYLGPQRGMFTVALLEALKGAACSLGPDGYVVRASDLIDYVRWRVDVLAAEQGLSQTPQPSMWGDAEQFVLAHAVEPLEQAVEIRVGGTGDEVIVQDHRLREVARHPITAETGTLTLRLRPGIYQIRRAVDDVPSYVTVSPSALPYRVDLVRA